MTVQLIKQFLKPNKKRLILSLFVFIIFSSIISVFIERPLWCGLCMSLDGCGSGPCGKTLESVKLLEAFVFILFDSHYKIPSQSIIVIVLLLIISYFMSLFAILIWVKAKKNCPEPIKQVLGLVKWGKVVAFLFFSLILWILFIFSSFCKPTPCITNETIQLFNLILNFVPNIVIYYLKGINYFMVNFLSVFIIPLVWYYLLFHLLIFIWDKAKSNKIKS